MTAALHTAWNHTPLRLLLLATLIAGSVAATYGIASVRAVPPGPGEVLLCVNSWTGDTRVVYDTDLCTGAYSYVVTVNQQGPPGPQGPQGPQGPPGPQGAQGPAGLGVDDFVVRSVGPVTIDALSQGEATASCLAGEVAVGGGYYVVPYFNVNVRVNNQSGGDSWFVQVLNNVNDENDLYVDVICAQP